MYIIAYIDHNHMNKSKINNNDNEKHIKIFFIKSEDITINECDNTISIKNIQQLPEIIATKNNDDEYNIDKHDQSVNIEYIIDNIRDKFSQLPIYIPDNEGYTLPLIRI